MYVLIYAELAMRARQDGIWSQIISDLEESSRPLDLGANCLTR